MERREKEERIGRLSDKRWSRLMKSFQESRDAQIRRHEREEFGKEIVASHQKHYDELLDLVIRLAASKSN